MRAITTILLLLLVSSCKFLEFRSGDDVVAQVGDRYLYKEDIRNLIPAGTPYGDSITMLRQYINSWALKYLIVEKAESQLLKEDKDVTIELEDYRNSLLAYRYEKLYIDQRLDTLVTNEEARNYYQANSSNISLNNSVVKARVIKISAKSPNLERIRSLYKAVSLEDIDELEKLCFNSADRYNNFNNQWADLSQVAREMPLDLYSCERELEYKQYIETKDSLYNYFAFFSERIKPDGTPPFEYYLPRIKEIIISKRKQSLISQLEKDLVREAHQKNKIKTNINDTPKNEQ